MRWKLTLLIAIVIGALAGSWIKHLPGFVIIAVDKTSYEMRIWVAVAILLLVLATLALIGSLLRSVSGGFGKIKGWHGKRNWRIARRKTILGMLAFTEGRWKQAEEAMVKAAAESETPLINFLVAAQAAQNQQAEVRRDAYLKSAFEAEPRAKVAIGITQAQLQLQNNQLEQALATLNDLRTKNPTHGYLLKLLCKTYLQLKDWPSLLQLLPALKKNKVCNSEQLSDIEQQCVDGVLSACAQKSGLEKLKDSWQKLPSSIRKSDTNRLVYARYLLALEQQDEAEKILRQLLKKLDHAEAILLYAEVSATDIQSQFNFLEQWHQSHIYAPNEIFLALGKLALKAEFWGKAGLYLEQAIQNQPTAEAYWLMAESLIERDENEKARAYHQKGLAWLSEQEKGSIKLLPHTDSDGAASTELLPVARSIN